ncbi:MAG: M3 family metallopeptidase [Wigglesworthia glossinidia]|nr:M3 family metallopeptidase [Wigglesworthia glossinidia]
MNNPLLLISDLPKFSLIQTKHVLPAVQVALDECRKEVSKIINKKSQFSWENLCQPFLELENYLNKVWSPISHLYSTNNTVSFRNEYKKSLILISEYGTWVGQNQKLYKAFINLKNSKKYIELNTEKKKYIDNTILDFKLSGVHLPELKQKKFSKIVIKLASMSLLYNNNILDSMQNWSKHITNKNDLSGIPKEIVLKAKKNAQKSNKIGWILKLNNINYISILTYCDNENLRKEMYYAYHTRASNQNNQFKQWDNEPIMTKILALRYQLSQILGFKNYAELSLIKKTIQSPKKVLEFIYNMNHQVRSSGISEIDELCKFSSKNYQKHNLKPWDIAYYSEKQKQHIFNINEEKLRIFFPESQVLYGLFKIAKSLYKINIVEKKNIDVWDKSVRFFEVFNEKNQLIGGFYLDLYNRKNKKEGAWMDFYSSRMRLSNGNLEKPVTYIICNFSSPSNHQSLLLHKEVITLFHEFGHNLQHLLTDVETLGVSGVNGIPWDAIEIASQLMENYCWHPESIKLISKHYLTGEKLPEIIINNLSKMRYYQSSLFILRQLEFSLFDLNIHLLSNFKEYKKDIVIKIFEKVKSEISITPRSKWERFPNTFSHIFSGGYASGYYSYLWANTLALDIWSTFNKNGILNSKIGKKFLNLFLSKGGSEDPLVLFFKFKKRNPQINYFLKYHGIQKIN